MSNKEHRPQRRASNFRIPFETAVKTCQKYGTLKKQGEKVKNWKTRYFALCKTNLLYYKSPEDKHFTGAINILNCPISRWTNNEIKHSLQIQTKSRTYYLAGSSEQEIDEWLLCLIEQSGYKLIVKVEDVPLAEEHKGCQCFTSIQDAIDAAKGGEKIMVYNGHYKENLWIEKPIQLCGYMTEEETKQKEEFQRIQYEEELQELKKEQAEDNENGIGSAGVGGMLVSSSLGEGNTNTYNNRNNNRTQKVEGGDPLKQFSMMGFQQVLNQIKVKQQPVGSNGKVIIENLNPDESIIVYRANGGVIQNITFQMKRAPRYENQLVDDNDNLLVSCIEMDSGALTLQNCTITSCHTGSGIITSNTSNIVLKECLITDVRDVGIWLMDRSRSTINRCKIQSVKQDSIRVIGESILHSLNRCEISGSGKYGVCLCDRSLCESIDYTSITESIGDNIHIQNEARLLRVNRCTLTKSPEFAINFCNTPNTSLSEDNLYVKLIGNKFNENKLGEVNIQHLELMGRFVKRFLKKKKLNK
ncbi:hypothetical protein ABK040_003237 [Willaertia magna]